MCIKLKVVSLFSGIGGFEVGLKNSKLNHEIVFSSEIDKYATFSYLSNFKNNNLKGDITKISEKEIPDHDLLVAGFPCQAFSIAGKQRGFDDIRGTLFFDVARILKEKKPKYLLLENVKNLISHDNGKTIKRIIETLNEIGYIIDFTIINSCEAGLPQNRERTYIIGVFNGKEEKEHLEKRNKKISKLKNTLIYKGFNFFNTLEFFNKQMYIKDIITICKDEKYLIKNEKINKFLEEYKFLYNKILEKKIIKLFDLPQDVWNDLERQRRVYSIYGISPTILARSDTTKILIEEEKLYIRKFTPAENFKLQGFDEEFIKNIVNNPLISMTQQYKQAGNAVSPPIITEIINHLKKIIIAEKKELKFIDLFCGLGGFRLALEKFGAKCVFSSDIDKNVQNTYKINFNEKPYGDITKISSLDIPNHNILCAGFPCQPFSIAGKRLGFDDTRGTLFFEVARILKEKKPDFFILENVKGIINHDSGRTLKVILTTLEEIGYNYKYAILNAKNYGVPQNRERWYCVGAKKDSNIDLNKFNFPKSEKLELKLIDIIDKKNIDKTYNISGICYKNIKKHIENKKIEITESTLAYDIRPSRCHFIQGEVSNCLTAKMGTGGSNVPVIISQNRKLTERECLRLMGFPEKYLIGRGYQSYKQIGNSVVIPVIEKIVYELIKLLKK